MCALFSAAALVLAGTAWLAFAPTVIGGSAHYVTTTGASMAPRFQTGDLALIRPADQYRVGDVVAYRSRLLKTVVLHRIIGRDGNRYVFKGDNNNFVDPTRPGRSELIGRLSLRIPHGGVLLGWLHTPLTGAVLIVAAALLLGLSTSPRRRRRRQRRHGATARHQGDRTMTPRRHPFAITAHQLLIASLAAAAAFALLGALAMTRPTTTAITAKTRYSENVDFAYHAAASDRQVYPRGIVRTGDPVFLRLVRRVRVRVDYRFASAAPHQISGSLAVAARLSSPNGWTRAIRLAAPARFTGDHARRTVTLDLPRLRAQITRIERLTGMPSGGTYTLAVIARPNVAGTLARQPLDSDFAPALNFQLDALQLRPGAAAQSTSGTKDDSLTPSRRAFVATAASTPTTLSIRGHGLPVAAARWIALCGLLLAAAGALLAQRRRRRPGAPAARIQARYGHLIVPIADITHNPARPTIDVSTIGALAQLADRSQRLILHHRHDSADSYLVDDEGTLYRYQTPGSAPPRHTPTAPHAAAPTTRPTGQQPSSGPPTPTPTPTTPPTPTPTPTPRRRRAPSRAAEAWLGLLRTRSSVPAPHARSATAPITRNTGP